MHLIRRGDPNLAVRSYEGLTTVVLSGELDLVLVQRVRPELDVSAREAAALTVDVRRLTFCDASGLGLLVRCARRVRSRRAAWTLLCDQPELLRLIRLAALDEVLRPSGQRGAGGPPLPRAAPPDAGGPSGRPAGPRSRPWQGKSADHLNGAPGPEPRTRP
ncbi:STAS domain-containing protein [Streptomyces sp. NPDC048717]|uniref:STAS domain-containing protein n=1 Tax=Streptomyces sp. NPDC048717 TaxID=3154928 RepID=UPI003423AF14